MMTDSSFSSFSVAGKVFLLGEYAVLAGSPALVAATGPRFKLLCARGSEGDPEAAWMPEEAFAPRSPAGRLVSWASSKGYEIPFFSFEDPHMGQGGFGASTAQFALLGRALAEVHHFTWGWKEAWELYRELTSSDPLPPSGADLVAQMRGGVVLFDPPWKTCEDLDPVFEGSAILVLSATHQEGRKVATHEHLAQLSKRGFPHRDHELADELASLVQQGVRALRQRDHARFGAVMNGYSEALRGAGLEHPRTYEDRMALQHCPGVLGVKGAGAMQSDALVVFLDSKGFRDSVVDAARARGLEPLGESVEFGYGMKREN